MNSPQTPAKPVDVVVSTLLGTIPPEFERSLFVYTTPQLFSEVRQELQQSLQLSTAVFLPFSEDSSTRPDAKTALEWEETAISISDIIMFWLPNSCTVDDIARCSVCFGKWASSGKVIYGREVQPGKEIPMEEEEIKRFGYIDSLAKRECVAKNASLQDCIAEYEKKTKNGVLRREGERYVPLHIFNHGAFAAWYAGMKRVGNRLDGCNFEWAFRVGPNKAFVLYWVLHVNIWVTSENRHKSNEIVLARGDIKCVFPYYIPNNVPNMTEMDCEIVLIKEFRSPARTEDCFIHELPGGSAFKAKDPIQEAIDELRQETGVNIDATDPEQKKRMKDHGARQLAGTTSAHQAHLFSVELTLAEIQHCREMARSGRFLGNASETEQTYVEVFNLGEAIKSDLIDWTTLGMLHLVLHDALEGRTKKGATPKGATYTCCIS